MSDRSMFGPDWTVSPTGNGNEHHLFDSRGKVAATGYKGEKLQYIADCLNRIAELEAIVAKLPHTADGVTVVPGMTVYYFGRSLQEAKAGNPDRCVSGAVDMPYLPIVRSCPPEDGIILGRHAMLCYSTPQAAEEASKACSDEINP